MTKVYEFTMTDEYNLHVDEIYDEALRITKNGYFMNDIIVTNDIKHIDDVWVHYTGRDENSHSTWLVEVFGEYDEEAISRRNNE